MADRKPRINIRHDFDKKDADDLWLKGWNETSESEVTRHYTRSGSLYTQVLDRTSISGSAQRCSPSYAGTTNGFSDFQEFSEWCQSEPGYLNRDHLGRLWVLDKDIASPNSKCYSPETCCFVPQRINNLIITSASIRGQWPIGVVRDKKLSRFRARIRDGTRSMKNLGMFNTAAEAHAAWQREKITSLRDAALLLPINCYQAIHGLNLHADIIEEDLLMNRETIR